MNTILTAGLALSLQSADPAAAHITDLGWLEGCWTGSGLGGEVSECWMSAPNGRMTGVFQFIDPDGAQQFSEIFILDAFEGGPALRLKHFGPDLAGWETQDDYVVFPLLETADGYALFDGLTYRLDKDGRLLVDVEFERDGETRTERLELDRRD